MPIVTVSMPVGPGVPDMLVRRARKAVLAQTLTDLRLVVIYDGPGAQAIEPASDPRVIEYRLPENRGRYFCDAVAFAATDSDAFAFHDSDDHAAPRWLETLHGAMMHRRSAVGLGAQTVQRLNGRTAYEPVRSFEGLRAGLHHHAHMGGVWARGWLDEIGGPHPAFRVGFDTLLTALPFVTGGVAVTREALYTRCKRAGSLTMTFNTGMRSPLRTAARTDLSRMWHEIVEGVEGGTAGERPVLPWKVRDLIREVLSAYPTPSKYEDLMTEVRSHAKDIADRIGEGSK